MESHPTLDEMMYDNSDEWVTAWYQWALGPLSAVLLLIGLNGIFRFDQMIYMINFGKYKPVPDRLDDITAEWCEWALRQGKTIGADITVASVNIERFKDETTGKLDGGGLCGAMLVHIKLTYTGKTTGEEPSSMVAKLSCGGDNYFPMFIRFGKWLTSPGECEEVFFRQEVMFSRKVLPIIEGYHHPKIYYTGIVDGGDRGFISKVIFNSSPRVKGITLMEDMSAWRTQRVGRAASLDDAKLCLCNAAALHAAFWGDKGDDIRAIFRYPGKAEYTLRNAPHSKIIARHRRKLVFSTNALHQKSNNIIEQYADSNLATLSTDVQMPEWFTAAPLNNGRYPVLRDPKVLEMLAVFSERFPAYNTQVAEPFLKRPVQTLLHGDFHCGNHLYGRDENEGKIVAVDFQSPGFGMVASEFIYLFATSISAHQLDSYIELSSVYHETLVKHGVTNYSCSEFKTDVRITFIEYMLTSMRVFTKLSPEYFTKMILGMSKEKGGDILGIVESGFFSKSFLAVTSMYLEDKDGFLISK